MLSPRLLELPELDLELVSRFLYVSALVSDGASDLLSPAPLDGLEGLERVVFLPTDTPDAGPGAPAEPWIFDGATLRIETGGELEILAALERLVGSFTSRALSSGEEVTVPPVAVRVDEALRPTSLARAGAAIATSWLESTSEPLHVALCSRVVSLSLLSPYPEDLGATLYALARRSPEFRPNEAWVEVLHEPPSRDRASLLAESLTRSRPELHAERRAAEASAGLELADGPVVTQGRLQGSREARVDASIGPLVASGLSLHLAASRSPLLLGELVRVLLAAERVSSITAAFEEESPSEVFTARVFTLEDDALSHPGCDAVAAADALIDRTVDWGGARSVVDGAYGLPIRLLRLTRRAKELHGATTEVTPTCLVGHRSWDLRRDDPREASAPLRAFRAALMGQFSGLMPVPKLESRGTYRELSRRR